MNTQKGPVICTIVAKNYTAFARTLCASFKHHHPDGECYVLFIDDIAGYVDPENESFEAVMLDEVSLPDRRKMCFWYNLTELATAVKPFFLEYLLTEKGLSSVAYLDPDIKIMAPMTSVFDQFNHGEMLLTPHLDTDFPEDGLLPDDAHILRSGVYNLGFFGVQKSENSLNFLKWWQKKLHRKCVIDHGKGYFVDQRFIDLAVTLFSGFHVLRDPVLNVAYWNLHSRCLERENGVYRVNGAPLVFYHFSGLNEAFPNQISKHQNRFHLEEMEALKMLFVEFQEELRLNGSEETSRWPYEHANYFSGRTIRGEERKVFRENSGELLTEDPFDYSSHSAKTKRLVRKEILKSKLKNLAAKLFSY